MKKCYLIILMALLMVQVTYAIKDCKPVMLPSSKDIPCLVISSWTFPNACNTYTIKIYNSNATLLDTRTMGDYGDVRCNITFDYTTQDSYLLNWSSGDSSKIIVEGEDKMASLSVMLFVCGITFALFFIGIKFNFSNNPVANLIIKRVIILLGMFLLSLDTAIILTMADNAGLGIEREMFRYLWLINWTIYLFMVWFMWNTVVNVLRLWERLSKEKRMGTNETEENE